LQYIIVIIKHLDTLMFKEQSPEALAPQLVFVNSCLPVHPDVSDIS